MEGEVVEGAFVELHSLSSADMNGRVGFCGPFNSGTGRFAVQLCQDGTIADPRSPLAIKAENLRRAPAPDTATRDAATAKIKEAGAAMERARGGRYTSRLARIPRLRRMRTPPSC